MTNEHERYSHFMDDILSHAPASTQAQAEMDRRDADVIRRLARTDFSLESRLRQSLKQKLLNNEKEPNMNSLTARKPLFRMTLLGVLLAFVLLAASPLGSTLAQSIVNIVQTWRLGDGSTAVSVEGDFEAIPDENGGTVLQPAPQEAPDFEDLIEDETPALGTNLAFEKAAEMVSFKLVQPAFIPQGYDFQGVTVSNAEKAQMDYLKFEEIGLIGLVQTVVGGVNGDVQVTFTSDMTAVEMRVNGEDGLWISASDGSGMLTWEADGINYQLQLMGVGDLELALQIAESLE